MRIFVVGDERTVLLFERWEADGGGGIDGVVVADVVAEVMRHGSQGEGVFIGIARIAQEGSNEIAAADVVGQVAEEFVIKRIVAEILNSATAIGIGVSLAQLRCSDGGEAGFEERFERGFPSEID